MGRFVVAVLPGHCLRIKNLFNEHCTETGSVDVISDLNHIGESPFYRDRLPASREELKFKTFLPLLPILPLLPTLCQILFSPF